MKFYLAILGMFIFSSCGPNTQESLIKESLINKRVSEIKKGGIVSGVFKGCDIQLVTLRITRVDTRRMGQPPLQRGSSRWMIQKGSDPLSSKFILIDINSESFFSAYELALFLTEPSLMSQNPVRVMMLQR